MSFLREISIFKGLSDSELESLKLFCQPRALKSWEILFKQWDEANAMYILFKWEIEIFTIKNWEEIILWKLSAEEILWEMAVFWNTKKRMATARAIKDTELIVFLDFSIKQLADLHPEILKKIKNIIEKRNKENNIKLNY